MTLLVLALLLAYTLRVGGAGWQLLLVAVVAFVPVTAVAINLVNWFTSQQVKPQRLPKLNFEEGIPASCQSLVVIPAMLTDEAEIPPCWRSSEQHYLRNPDPNLGFALLTDFNDAPQAEMPGDDALCQQARQGIQTLNQHYPTQPFYLLHRHRQHNPSEGVWMGWERKRGKLEELNYLLRGSTTTSYTIREGDMSRLPAVQFVITLDADTILPTDAAQRLVGTLAHPLNRARCDAATGRVVSGLHHFATAHRNSTGQRRTILVYPRLQRRCRPGFIPRWPSLIFTRTYLARAFLWAKAFMMLMPLYAVWLIAFLKTVCSAMTCLKGCMAAPLSSPILYCTKNIRRTIWSMCAAPIAGFVAIGSCCPGCGAQFRLKTAV
ncbi:MAG: hypothetical protein M5U34_05705 [Chloroflexi bacterium]|nr:hypothetical protein [Chloroflexota bacterium]